LADPVPTISFSIDLVADPALKPTEVVVGGKKFDLTKVGQKVRVSGPRDRRICPICIQFVGRIYDRDDPKIQMFREGGAHPRCRHYLTPVGLPGLDREITSPGIDFVSRAQSKGDRGALRALYGETRADVLLKDLGLDPLDLYRPDGRTLIPLDELVSRGVITKETARKVGGLLSKEAA
jgi:hypothetical protein